MFDIVFLGTSASAPSIQRGLPAQMVLHKEYRFLIDCGEGTQRQILQSGLGFKRLDKILITHSHLDHILGLAGLLSTFMRWEAMEKLEIWAGPPALARIRDLLYGVVLRGGRPPVAVEFHTIEPGCLIEDETFRLSAFPVTHRGGGTFGFLFEEKARRPFLAERAESLGVPPGPLRARLVAGKAVTLPDGSAVEPDEVLGPLTPGTRLAFVGDCGRTDNILERCRGADALVIEATYLDVEAELAREFSHLTARQAAQLARDARVRRLFLTHLSRRYRDREVLEEARAVFAETTVVKDFDRFSIAREK
ncbi:MAG: ribonuclease Z [Anaerolineales bacterium]|nr:ribonuclease Z [Anaerolineales bacterium]